MKIANLKSGLQTGLTYGIIFTFLILIGFITVGTDLIGEIIGNLEGLDADGRLPAVNILLFLSLLGLIAGITAYKSNSDLSWLGIVLKGLSTGLSFGLLVGIVIFFLGLLQTDGVDFRTYLPKLGPQYTSYLLFYSRPLAAAQAYFSYLLLSSLAGILLAKAFSYLAGLKRAFKKAQEGMSEWTASEKIRRVLDNKLLLALVIILLGIGLYFMPFIWGTYWNYIMGTVAIYILLGLGLNIIVGYSGQLVLGYVAFFATGAYTFALLTAPEPQAIGLNFWLAVGISILVSTLTGLLLGLPILNLRGDYLAIVTLGFGEIIRILIRSDLLTPLTNGPKGITQVGQPNWRGQIFSDINYMHLLMLLVLIGLFVAKRLKDSRTGRAWIAIREDQTVAQATGVNTFKYKMLALVLGAAFAGLSGALFASRNQFTGPEDFTLMVSVNVLCIVIVGGMGSLPGVIIGAFVLKGLPELLRELEDYRLLVFGLLLVVMMIIRPEGLWPVRRNKYARPELHDESLNDNAAEINL